MRWAIQHMHQFTSFLCEGEPVCTKPVRKEPLPVLLKAADEVWDFGVFLSGVLPVHSPSSSSSSSLFSSSSLLHAWSKFWFLAATQWRQKFRHRALEMWWLWRHWRWTSENIRGYIGCSKMPSNVSPHHAICPCNVALHLKGAVSATLAETTHTRHWIRCMIRSQSNYFQHTVA